MKNRKILVLGDCASNGNNSLGHEVYNDNNICLTFSLMYHKKFPDVVRWYIGKKRKNRFFDNGKIDYRYIEKISMDALRKAEKENSWPNHLDYKVTNKSINGNHFLNYILQFENYYQENQNVDLILITDYTPNHMVIYFTHLGKKYKFLCTPEAENEIYNPDLHDYCEQVHAKKIDFIKKQNKYRNSYQTKKHQRYLKLLLKKVKEKNIPYVGILMRKNNSFLFEQFQNVIDLSQIKEQWCAGNEYDSGEICVKKFNLQKDCAKKVDKFLQIYFQ